MSVQTLTSENEVLQAEVAQYQAIASELPQASSGTVRAMVYSRYPLNFRNEILIDAGGNDNVQEGKAVIFQGALIGVVIKVFPDSALVQTLFDTAFKMPVRIGSEGVDGLLAGGAYPKAISISKDATVAVGDVVYAAAPGIPYALPVGKIASIAVSSDNLFQEATLGFAYDINDIETVEVEQ